MDDGDRRPCLVRDGASKDWKRSLTVMDIFQAPGVGSGQRRRRCVNWADGPVEWFMGPVPKVVGRGG